MQRPYLYANCRFMTAWKKVKVMFVPNALSIAKLGRDAVSQCKVVERLQEQGLLSARIRQQRHLSGIH
jgi:hypothetical protein